MYDCLPEPVSETVRAGLRSGCMFNEGILGLSRLTLILLCPYLTYIVPGSKTITTICHSQGVDAFVHSTQNNLCFPTNLCFLGVLYLESHKRETEIEMCFKG